MLLNKYPRYVNRNTTFVLIGWKFHDEMELKTHKICNMKEMLFFNSQSPTLYCFMCKQDENNITIIYDMQLKTKT